jgi:hypothetical protein
MRIFSSFFSAYNPSFKNNYCNEKRRFKTSASLFNGEPHNVIWLKLCGTVSEIFFSITVRYYFIDHIVFLTEIKIKIKIIRLLYQKNFSRLGRTFLSYWNILVR